MRVHILPGGPQRIRLGLTSAFSNSLGKVGKQYRKPQNDGNRQRIAAGSVLQSKKRHDP